MVIKMEKSKKPIIIMVISIIIILIIGICIAFYIKGENYKKTYDYKLGLLGYKKEEITSIKSLDEDKINIILNHDYNELINVTGKNYFLGVKLNSSNQVTNAYVCGVKDDVPFCIEGTSDGSTYNDSKILLQGADLYNNTLPFSSTFSSVSRYSGICLVSF